MPTQRPRFDPGGFTHVSLVKESKAAAILHHSNVIYMLMHWEYIKRGSRDQRQYTESRGSTPMAGIHVWHRDQILVHLQIKTHEETREPKQPLSVQ